MMVILILMVLLQENFLLLCFNLLVLVVVPVPADTLCEVMHMEAAEAAEVVLSSA